MNVMEKHGYKVTPIGTIPFDWKILAIGDATEVSAGGTPSTSNDGYWNPPEIPWMSSGEVHQRQVYTTDKMISRLGLQNSSARIFPKLSVVMALAGQGKTRGCVAVLEAEVATNQSLAAIYPNTHFDTYYLLHNLDWRYKELRSLSSGEGGRGGLNLSIIKSIQVATPPLPEQKKIAATLTAVDKKLSVTARQITVTKTLKQGLMQTLFSRGIGMQDISGHWVPHSEFKDSEFGPIPEKWKCITLKILCGGALQTGPFGSQLHANEYQDEGVSVLMPKDLVNNRANKESAAKISQGRAVQLEKHKVAKGDLLFSRRGDVTRFALIDDKSEGSLCGTGCLKAKPTKDHSPSYLSHLLQLDTVKQWLEQNAVGQTMPNMNTRILSSLPLVVPPTLAEEEEIAGILDSVDEKLNVLTTKQIHYQTLKRGLMQKLLTGEWRVKLDDVALTD